MMNVDLNKKSVKQQGGQQMIPNEPGMQQQPQVDPQVMQIAEMFNQSMESGQRPEEVVVMLMEQGADQNIIGQALMQVGMAQEDVVVIFENVQKMQQPKPPTAEQITNNPQQLAREEEMQEDSPNMDIPIDPMEMAKSGIEIKPENKGKFTRWAKARGMSVAQAYKKVLANKEKYPPSVVKMANFARNAAGWKKGQEGVEILEPSALERMQAKLRGLMKRDERASSMTPENSPLFWGTEAMGGIPEGYALNPLQTMEFRDVNQNGIEDREEGLYIKRDLIRKEDLPKGNPIGRFIESIGTGIPLPTETPGKYAQPKLQGGGDNYDAVKAAMLQTDKVGADMQNQLASFMSQVNFVDSSKPKEKDNRNFIDKGQDEGVLNPGPLYVNPAIYNNNKFNLGKAANVLLEGYENMFSGKDKDGDGVKDGSFRDWRGKAIKNKLDKYRNATYTINYDGSEENIQAMKDFQTQFMYENQDSTPEELIENTAKFTQQGFIDGLDSLDLDPKIKTFLTKSTEGMSDVAKQAYNDLKAKILKDRGIEIEEDTSTVVEDTTVNETDPNFIGPPEAPTDEDIVIRYGAEVLPKALFGFGKRARQAKQKIKEDPISFARLMAGDVTAATAFMQTGGAPFANQTLTFQEWFLQDPVTRSGPNAQQEYEAYVQQQEGPQLGPVQTDTPSLEDANQNTNTGTYSPQLDKDGDGIPDYIDIDGGDGSGQGAPGTLGAPEAAPGTAGAPSAEEYYSRINKPELDVNTGGLKGFLDRVKNSTVATAFGDVSDFAVKAADVVNDYFDQKAQEEAMDDLRVSLSADNIYGTKTDAFNKRGTFDVNTGIMGSEGDATTGLYLTKKGGEFKPHMMYDPKNGKGYMANKMEDHLRMKEMGYLHKEELGKAKQGGETVSVDSAMLAKLIAAGADIEML